MVLSEVLKIPWDPASVDENTAGLAVLVKVSVHGSNSFDAALVVLELLDHDLVLDVEHTLDLNRLERPLLGILVDVLATPGKSLTVVGRDVDGLGRKSSGSSRGFAFLILSTTTLELSGLLRKQKCRQREAGENEFLRVHF